MINKTQWGWILIILIIMTVLTYFKIIPTPLIPEETNKTSFNEKFETKCNMINTLRGCEYYFMSRNYTLNLKQRTFWDENSMLVNSSYKIKDDYKLICKELNSTNLICEPKYITYERHLYEGNLIIGDKTTKVLYVNDKIYTKSDLLQCEYRERQYWGESYQIYNNNTKILEFCEFCNIRCWN